MGLDTKHKCVAELEESWRKVRDCAAGPRVIKAAREKYLPRLKAHTGEKKGYLYERYLDRAVFVPATGRTKRGYEGLVFAKPPEVKVPDESILKDVTLTGVTWLAFARQIFGQVVAPGRVTILVDMAEESDLLPAPALAYQRWYAAENLTYWREETVEQVARRLAGIRSPNFQQLEIGEGTKIATHARLFEMVDEQDPKDEWATVLVPQFRVIDLVDVPTNDGVTVGSVQRLFRKNEKATSEADRWVLHRGPIVSKRRGVPVPFIPVVPTNQESVAFEPEEPALLGFAEINLSQYKTSADLENARFKLGHPQLYIFGITNGADVEIGDSLWHSENANAKAGSVQVADEFGGLERAMEEKRQQMIEEGARLMAKTEVQRTATEAMLERSGERSMLTSMVESCSEGLALALAYQSWWNDGVTPLPAIREKVSVKLNTAFSEQILTGSEALSWMQVQIGGGISKDSLLEIYKRGGALPHGRKVEDEKALIAADQEAALADLEDGGDLQRGLNS